MFLGKNLVTSKRLEVGKLRGWKVGRSGGKEVGRLGSREVGKSGDF